MSDSDYLLFVEEVVRKGVSSFRKFKSDCGLEIPLYQEVSSFDSFVIKEAVSLGILIPIKDENLYLIKSDREKMMINFSERELGVLRRNYLLD